MSPAKLIERIVHLVLVLFGVSVIVFLMLSVTPGDPVDIMIGDQQVTQAQRDSLRQEMGLDRPLLARYERFAARALKGDLGMSYYYRRPVLSVMAERMPPTVELTLAALILALITAIPLGVLAAVKKNSLFDRLATLGSLFGVSMPGFWFGLLLIMLFGVTLHWLPVTGQTSVSSEVPAITRFLLVDTLLAGNIRAFGDALAHILLPAITLGLPMATVIMRVTRSSMLEVLKQDYVSFAQAKGLAPRRVMFRHALKNALIPTVTVTALEVGSLLGGSMIVETIFGWPGLGRLVVESIFTRDYPLIQAAVLLYAVIYVLINFAADILYTKINPRVSL